METCFTPPPPPVSTHPVPLPLPPAPPLNQEISTAQAINHLLGAMPSQFQRELTTYSETEPETDAETPVLAPLSDQHVLPPPPLPAPKCPVFLPHASILNQGPSNALKGFGVRDRARDQQ